MVLLREIDSEMENIRHSRFLAKRLQSAMHHVQNILIHLQRSGTHSVQQIRKLEQLRDNLRAIYSLLYSLPVMGDYSYRPQLEHSGRRGRPSFQISREQLECLRREYNSWAQIARDLGVSRQTVYNLRRRHGFSLQFEGFTLMPDTDLDTMVQNELCLSSNR